MSDYTVLPNQIAETLKKAGAPLNDNQLMLLSGALAVWQDVLNTPSNQWVSVESDIKPKMYQQVIIYTTDSDFCPTQRLAHWNGEKEGFLVGGGYRDRQATHWQPLPQPPEGE